jgi:membrane protein
MTRLKQMLFQSAPARFLLGLAGRIHLPGFEGMSLREAGGLFFSRIGKVKLSERVAAVTYNLLMAIPPGMLFLFSLVPYLPLRHVEQTILSTLNLVVPNERVRDTLSSVIVDFMNTERTDLLSFGILGALFFSSNGMMGLMRSFDRSLSVYRERTGLKRRWTAIKLTFMLIWVVIFAIAVFILQTQWLNVWLIRIFGSTLAIRLCSLLLLALIMFCSISLVYTYGPSLSHRFRFVSPGSVFATVLIILVTTVFFYLVNNFINYNQIYGSIGSLIAFMVWMWLNTLIILVGYELNVSILLGKIKEHEAGQKN